MNETITNKNCDITVIDKEKDIHDKIHIIRGQQVMLDSDLAELYGYEVKNLNKQVKRNIEKFPEDFMFQLTNEETSSILRFQNGTSNNHGGRRYNPYVFTEQGVYMLSSVLKGEIAVQQTIFIMRTFKSMRHYIVENQVLLHNSTEVLNLLFTKSLETDLKISKLENKINNIDKFININEIKQFSIFKDKKFEGDEIYINLFSSAQTSIYIIDNYPSIKLLSHLKHKKENVNVILFTENFRNRQQLRKTEVEDFNLQYPLLILKHNENIHDRYIVIDYKTENEHIYHCGASIKDTGKKLSVINEIIDKEIYHNIIDNMLLQDSYVLED